jgi:hypothetical protein
MLTMFAVAGPVPDAAESGALRHEPAGGRRRRALAGKAAPAAQPRRTPAPRAGAALMQRGLYTAGFTLYMVAIIEICSVKPGVRRAARRLAAAERDGHVTGRRLRHPRERRLSRGPGGAGARTASAPRAHAERVLGGVCHAGSS